MIEIKKVYVTLDDDISNWLDGKCEAENITRSNGINSILKGWIYGNQHKGFVRVEIKRDNVDENKIWKGGLMTNGFAIVKKVKEYYIFETFFNGNLQDVPKEHSDEVINALIGILKKEKVRLLNVSGDMTLIVEMDSLIRAVKERDIVKLQKLIHPKDIRIKRYMKGNFDDLTHEQTEKLRQFINTNFGMS